MPDTTQRHARKRREPVTAEHRRVIAWMATPAFRELVALHQTVLGDRATIYFRPTDEGLVRIALHPAAPCYVGFHEQAGDRAHIFNGKSALPTIDQLRKHWQAFEVWLRSVRRQSDEERGVISWLRGALTNQLWLPELGDGWVFLGHEWRFIDGQGECQKSDALAVHLSTGQLGIVELKSKASALAKARTEVVTYAALWDQHAEELAPLFTKLLQALGLAYGNKLAAKTVVKPSSAALFVGIASPGEPVRICRYVGV